MTQKEQQEHKIKKHEDSVTLTDKLQQHTIWFRDERRLTHGTVIISIKDYVKDPRVKEYTHWDEKHTTYLTLKDMDAIVEVYTKWKSNLLERELDVHEYHKEKIKKLEGDNGS